TPGKTIMSAETYNRMFTLHGAVMVFLVIIPSIPASLGNFILPLQLGAKDVAFPRLNLLSYYLYVIGAVFAIYSMITGAVDTGWTFYTPYSALTPNSVISMTLAVFILGFSSIFTGINFIVTIHALRAPGLTFYRLPLFVWALYATALMQVLATPVLGITLLLLIAERVLKVGIFDPAMGGDPVLFQHFFWFYSHPAVYIMIVPGFGVISELIATFCKKPIFGYRAVALSSIGIAIISFLVWGHHMFTSGQSVVASMIFSFLTFLVAIPTAIKAFNWVATMYKGSIWLATPMLYALAFLWVFTIGGLTGLFLSTTATDVHLHDTYFVVAHFHYVMMGGTIFAFFGGLHYWWPKITGRMYNETLGKWSWVVTFIGFNMTFFVQFIMGAKGMPRRYYNYLPEFGPYHSFSTVGSWILGLGFFLTAYCLLSAIWKGKKAGDNPWGGTTLEWHTSSPPPLENFLTEPRVSGGPYDRT
ncbi:MAG: cbb3-type cytochrome c oxidase subunit I, partial [Myxococcales bacterium]|nr:cbb3-type cytochrome c oxidase subunit I [Myxococcales bacterium]